MNNKQLAPLSEATLRTNGAMLPPFPFMSRNECEFLESYLTPNTTMLEWGSGYSTVRFSQQVKKYFSIEHNKKWYEQIKPLLGENTTYTIAEGTKLSHRPAASWGEIDNSLRMQQFFNYVHAIEQFKCSFDIIFVDGRARCECAKVALPHIKNNGFLFIHNWNRPYYHIILEKYQLVSEVRKMALLQPK